MFDKEHKNFDAVTVAIPDHNHAVVGLATLLAAREFGRGLSENELKWLRNSVEATLA